jgi:hypothetical protein
MSFCNLILERILSITADREHQPTSNTFLSALFRFTSGKKSFLVRFLSVVFPLIHPFFRVEERKKPSLSSVSFFVCPFPSGKGLFLSTFSFL